MNRAVARATVIFLAILVLAAITPAHAAKRALLIGVSDYSGRNIKHLHCENDVLALKAVLVNHFRFSDNKRDMLVKTSYVNTTGKAILKAFEELVRFTKQGDIVVIHYSGHGRMVSGRDGNIIHTLIPSDAPSDEDLHLDISDTVINFWLGELKKRRPKSVLVTFDCCYSGGAYRDPRVSIRGKDTPPNIGLDKMPRVKKGIQDPLVDWPGCAILSACSQGGESAGDSKAKAHEIVLPRTDIAMGCFSYALANSLTKASKSTTIQELYDSVRATMLGFSFPDTQAVSKSIRTVQKPFFNLGCVLSNNVIGGSASNGTGFGVRKDNTGSVILSAGAVQGVVPGEHYSVLTKHSKYVSATVSSVELMTSDLRTEQPKALSYPTRAVRASQRLVSPTYKVNVSKIKNSSKCIASLRSTQLVAVDRSSSSTDWDLQIVPAGNRGLTVLRRDGTFVQSQGIMEDNVVSVINGEAKWSLINTLSNTNTSADARFDMHLVPVVLDDSGNYVRDSLPEPSDPEVRLYGGECLAVEVKALAGRDIYVTVLNLSPNGDITAVWPSTQEESKPQTNLIRADGKWHRLWRGSDDRDRVFFRSVGDLCCPTEVFKAIATIYPTDFSPVASASPGNARTPKTDLEKLVLLTSQGESRSPVDLDSRLWYTHTAAVSIFGGSRPASR